MQTNIIITMAGNGDRFRRAGYHLPKFKIEARGQTLFHWALKSLSQFTVTGGEVVFAARPDHEPDAFIAAECEALGIRNFRVVPIEAVTDGQATTALIAGQALSRRGQPLIVYNIDTYVDPDYLSPHETRGEGWIPCFPGVGEGWSFARLGASGHVEELAEKRRISPHATVGLYWFRSFDVYQDCYETHFRTVGTEKGERYIAPMYNTLIRDCGDVWISTIPSEVVHPLGTPEEVEAFRQ